MDTKAAEASIQNLMKAIRNLNQVSDSSRTVTPSQAGGLSSVVQNSSKLKQLRDLNPGNASTITDRTNTRYKSDYDTILRGNSEEISKLTIEQLMAVRRSISGSTAGKTTAVRTASEELGVEIDKIIASKIRVETDNAAKFLVGRPGTASYLRQLNPGQPAGSPISVEKSLTDISKISPDVMPGITERIDAIQTAINTHGGEGESSKVNAMIDDLFRDVDTAVLKYTNEVKSKIKASLLENSSQSKDFFRAQVNTGARSEILGQVQSQAQRTDLTKEQALALGSNFEAMRAADVNPVDEQMTQAGNAVQKLLRDIGEAAVKVEQAAMTESTQTRAASVDAVANIRSRKNRNQRNNSVPGSGNTAPTSSGGNMGGGGGGLGTAAGKMEDDASKADREVNSAFRRLNKVITDASAVLNSTATIAKGSLRVRDKPADLAAFAKDLSKGMQDYVNTVNDAFNNVKLPGGKKVPQDILRNTVNQSLQNGDISGFTALPNEQRGLAIAASGRAYGQSAGLQGAAAQKFELAYVRSIEDLIQQQTKLGEAVQIANLKTIEKNRADIELLIQEGKYEEAMKIATSTLITKTERDAMGNVRVTSEPIGKQTPAELIDKGYTTDSANAAYKGVQDTTKKIIKHQDINKEASGLTKLTRFAGQAMTVYGFLAMTIGTVVMKVIELTEKANKLEKASATVNALAGSMSKYQSVLAIATSQQNKFGGTLEENLQGFVSLVPATKKFGLDLEQVDNIARRLAIVDPLQGFSGAAIALKEFLSGDITSLSRRFEIDRKTLNSIKEAGSKADQLKELDRVLNSMGISQGVLAARTATAAASFDKAASAWDNYETLLGQGLQEFLKPVADSVTGWFSEAAGELSNNLLLQTKEQNIYAGFDGAIKASKDISTSITEANKPASALNSTLADSADSMTTLTYGAKNLQYELNNVVMTANNAVDELNKLRLANDKEGNFVAFKSSQDAILASRAGQYLGSAAILKAREQGVGLGPDEKFKNYGNPLKANANNIQSLSSNFSNPLQQNIMSGSNTTEFQANILAQLAEASNLKLKGPEANNFAKSALRDKLLQGVVPESELKNLSDADKATKILIKTLNDAKLGYISASVAVERFNVLLGAKKDELVIPGFIKEIGRQQKIMDDYDVVYKKIGDNTFATDLYNKSVGAVNNTTQEINDAYTKQIALIYYNNTAIESGDKSHITAQQASLALGSDLFQIEGDTVVERENAAKVIAEASILQTRLLLDQEKSVSVIGAMGDNFGKYLVDLESATKLAIDFNKSMSSLVTGPLMAGMSLQDQLNFSQMTMSGNVPGMEPQNQGDILSSVSQTLGLVTQIEQEKLDNGNKSSNEIRDMNKEFFKDQAKARADHDKDMKDLEEEHLKKMEEMQRESEISKRSNEVGFYESLFSMDNLSADQIAQAGAEYQTIKAEATNLRGQGQYEKAAAVETAGKEGILSKYGDLEKKAKLTLDIQDADKETADLNAEMGKAKTADDRAEIQRKIDKIAVEKLKYENELAQIVALEKMKKDLYEAELNNARTLQESETENYKIEVDKRNTDFNTAEEEKTKKHKEEIDKRALAENQAHKVQISNLNEQIALMTFSNSFLDEAYARTLTGPAQSSKLAAIYATRQSAKDTIMSSNSLAAPTLQEGLRRLESAGPSMVQAMAASLSLNTSGGDISLIQKELSTKTGDLVIAMNKFTDSVLTGKIIILRVPGF
jgi:hypothetical protein